VFRLSVCADTVFTELPFVERARAIARAGFEVEFWGWRGRDLDALAADPAIRVCAFTGYLGGSIVEPGGVDEFLPGRANRSSPRGGSASATSSSPRDGSTSAARSRTRSRRIPRRCGSPRTARFRDSPSSRRSTA
jgi:hypothetical protein